MENTTQYFIIKGELLFKSITNPTVGTFKRDKSERFRCSIHNPAMRNDDEFKQLLSCYNPEGDYTPKWVKEALETNTMPEYLNFKSMYPLRVFVDNGEREITDLNTVNSGATGYMKIKITIDDESETHLYPVSFLMKKNGEKRNQFADCDF